MIQRLFTRLTRRAFTLGLVIGLGIPGCSPTDGLAPPGNEADENGSEGKNVEKNSDEDQHRSRMVERQLRGRDIRDERVLEAMGKVPRHLFVPERIRSRAYADGALPIGAGQTISQPYIVALMTQLSGADAGSRALDIGTGSGYQAAVLAEIADRVYSIEIVESLADEARSRLKSMNYTNIEVRCGDGYQGWPDQAPFDVIIVAAAPDHIPQPLVDQLAPGGRLIIPVGEFYQVLTVIEKKQDGSTEKTTVVPVAFVPMTGKAQQER